jgi:hypothetical protein
MEAFTMKKLAILLAILLLPASAFATATAEGDPGFFVFFPSGTQYVIAGELWEYEVGPANFAFTGECVGGTTDTFCVLVTDLSGWTLTGDPAFGTAEILDPGYLWWQMIYVEVPCEVTVGETNTVTAGMRYSDGVDCYPLSPVDCYDPNMYSGVPRPSTITVDFEVVESPPALYILQDSLYFVEQGQTAAYIPFSICNGDPCAPPTAYNYVITSTGVVGGAINQSGQVTADGGACVDVYGIIDGGSANVCDYDELTIIVWDDETGTVYDTCVQLIHVVTPVPVPLFTAPVVTILVLAMILAAAVIMKRHAVSKA